MSIENTDPQPHQYQCVMEISEPYVDADGKLMQTILSKHSDGFTCLRFVEVDQDAKPSSQDGPEPDEPEALIRF